MRHVVLRLATHLTALAPFAMPVPVFAQAYRPSTEPWSGVPFAGLWSPDQDKCNDEFYNGRVYFEAKRYDADEQRCTIRSLKKVKSNIYDIRATCAGDGDTWQEMLRVTVYGETLIVTSIDPALRGSMIYKFCRRPMDSNE
jgi:hypothetical protein